MVCAATPRSSHRLRVFRFVTNGVLPAAKPEDIGSSRGDPMPHPMSPLRAVVSRGHIAFSQAQLRGAFALCFHCGLRESPFDCTARCAPYIILLLVPALQIDRARFAREGHFRLHAGVDFKARNIVTALPMSESARQTGIPPVLEYVIVPDEGETVERENETTTVAPTATAKRDLSELVRGNVLRRRGRGRSITDEFSPQIVSWNMSRRGENQPVGSCVPAVVVWLRLPLASGR